MPDAKLVAARQLIQEKQYDAARAILQTMDNATARQWLIKLDKIAPVMPRTPQYPVQMPPVAIPPPPPLPQQYVHLPQPAPVPYVNAEQERFYRAENRRRRRRQIGNGIELILFGGALLVGYSYYQSLPHPTIPGSAPTTVGLEVLLVPLGLVAILGGIAMLLRRN
jgi:hypothetical protein